jgi:hypothetical protein
MARFHPHRPVFAALLSTVATVAGCTEAFRIGLTLTATPPGLHLTLSHEAAAATKPAVPATVPAAPSIASPENLAPPNDPGYN